MTSLMKNKIYFPDELGAFFLSKKDNDAECCDAFSMGEIIFAGKAATIASLRFCPRNTFLGRYSSSNHVTEA